MSTLVLRVDGSEQIGYGHAVRCLALAQAWRDKGGTVSVVCACLPPAVRKEFIKEQVQIIDLPQADSATALMLKAFESAEWVVFDSYDLPGATRDLARVRASHVGMIDDFSRSARPVDVDLLIDQNLGATETSYASDRIGSLALGPEFALLRRCFGSPGELRRPVDTKRLNILVSLGGSRRPEIAKAMVRTTRVLTDLGHQVTAVGPDFGPSDRKFNLLPQLLPDFDLAISAAGSTVWELLWAGVPLVVIPITDNQVPIASHLAGVGAAEHLPTTMAKFSTTLQETAIALINNPERRVQMTARGRNLVDGLGAQRVVKIMKALTP
jgi:spore coat polysaccharide biosynthesis predicted glycosyltransferase SpsG